MFNGISTDIIVLDQHAHTSLLSIIPLLDVSFVREKSGQSLIRSKPDR